MIIVRYADDVVVGFERASDASRFLDSMRARLEEFSLSLHPDKTRLIEFGRDAAERRKKKRLGKPETILAPSARWSQAHGKRHKTLTRWARQAIMPAKRWLPNRRLVFVADSGFAALDLLARVRRHVCVITRLRLDANLFRPAPKRRRGRLGRPPLKGPAQPKLSAVLKSKKTVWTSIVVSQWYNAQQRTLLVATGTAVWYHAGLPPVPIGWVVVRDPSREHEPSAFLSTDLDATPAAMLGWFVSRWRVETTFQEARVHLGIETQRQWSDLAILRTTPALFGLFSLITVWADELARGMPGAVRPNAAAWYCKQASTFSDAIAAVRRVLWALPNLSTSPQTGDTITISASLISRLSQTLSRAA